MHSHSFQDIELKLHKYVNDSTVQVAEWFTILQYPGGVRNKGLITQKTKIRRAFAQFSRYRVETSQVYVNDSTVQVAECFTILQYPGGVRNEGLITQKT